MRGRDINCREGGIALENGLVYKKCSTLIQRSRVIESSKFMSRNSFMNSYTKFYIFIYTLESKLTSESIYTRLLGRFAPIFHFHCEHVLFVYIVKKKFRIF